EHGTQPADGELTAPVRVDGEAQLVGEEVLRQPGLRVSAVDGEGAQDLMCRRVQQPKERTWPELRVARCGLLVWVPSGKLAVRGIEVCREPAVDATSVAKLCLGRGAVGDQPAADPRTVQPEHQRFGFRRTGIEKVGDRTSTASAALI